MSDTSKNGEFIQTMAVELPSVRAFVNGDGQIEIEGVSAFEGDMTIKPGAGFLKKSREMLTAVTVSWF
ncbi:MAG: hypothetical protein L6V93_19915 [Clostridiales bacterium]|nr:MAG: hypothetical protein L6V93_19915 [Clostridiales bacterium]